MLKFVSCAKCRLFKMAAIYIGFSTNKSKVIGRSALNGCIFFFAFLDGGILVFFQIYLGEIFIWVETSKNCFEFMYKDPGFKFVFDDHI